MSVLDRRAALKAGGAALATPFLARTAWAEEVVHVYNWTDYIGETTLDDFRKATGIKAVYDTYDSTESVEAKLLAGKTGYDVILHSGIDSAALRRGRRLPEARQVEAAQLEEPRSRDPEDHRGLGSRTINMAHPICGAPSASPTISTWSRSACGDKAPLSSLDILMKPEYAAKLADCGISVLESPSDVIPMVLKYLGKDPNTTNPADFEAVVEAFKPIRQYIKTFDASNYLNAIPNKELCVINDWSGDYATARNRAKEAGVELNLAYYVPDTGAARLVRPVDHSEGCAERR